MSKFIVYEHNGGETIFIDRASISSFHPKYVDKNLYRVYVTVGNQTYPVVNVTTLDEAKSWIAEQIEIIEGISKKVKAA